MGMAGMRMEKDENGNTRMMKKDQLEASGHKTIKSYLEARKKKQAELEERKESGNAASLLGNRQTLG